MDNAAAGARGESQGPSEGQAARAAIDRRVVAELWLKSEGKHLVVARLLVTPTLAETMIERWVRELEGGRQTLADILRGLSTTPHGGARFTELVRDRVAAARELQDGPLLAMGPTPRVSLARRLPSQKGPKVETEQEIEQTKKVRHG